MKRLFSLLFILTSVLTSFAQLSNSGYYRVQNYGSSRYIYVCDATSSGVNISTTSADLGAVQTWRDPNKPYTDPASVIYFEQHGSQWDFQAQGTGVHQMINYFVSIDELSRADNIYQVSATASGQTLFLYDDPAKTGDRSNLTTGGNNGTSTAKYRRWHIHPMNQTDNYIGVAPKIAVDGKNYAPYYASFPFSFYSSGMKAYYITKVDKRLKVAVKKEVTGIVPSAMPIILECSSTEPTANKLQLENYTAYNQRPADNVLQGVYFANRFRISPVAYKEYNSATMRLLGKTANGKLGFITANNSMLVDCGDSSGEIWCIPANHSYLPVDSDCPAELTIVSEQEYEDMQDVLVQSISFNKTNIEKEIGAVEYITATILPENATYKNLRWTSSNEAIATVEGTSTVGKVTLKSVGTAVITATATDGTGISATCTVTVKPTLVTSITFNKTEINREIGRVEYITATILPDNATYKNLRWTSSDEAIATVEGTSTVGKVTIKAIGTAIITATATDGSNISATCVVNGKPTLVTSITFNKAEINREIEGVEYITATILPDNATYKDLRWTSSDEAIATVEGTSTVGKVTVKAIGTAIITATATDGSNISATCVVNGKPTLVTGITLDKTEITGEIGFTDRITATVMPDNATTKAVNWTSSNEQVATVDATGLVALVGIGTCTITATTTDGTNLSASCSIVCEPTMVEEIILSRNELTISVLDEYQLEAVVRPENATNPALIWESAAPEIATVSQTGLVHGLSVGSTVVKVTPADGSECEALCIITCTPASGIQAVSIEQIPAGSKFYNLAGQRLSEPTTGIIVIRYPDGTCKRVYLK